MGPVSFRGNGDSMNEYMTAKSAITKELIRLNQENGGVLTPHEIVEAAKNENSPLHDFFDWNDTEAARKWRIEQARHMLRICVWYDNRVSEKNPMRVFVSLTTDRKENEGYRVITEVMNDEERRAVLMSDAEKELATFQRKYSMLVELNGIFDEIEKLKKKRRIPLAV